MPYVLYSCCKILALIMNLICSSNSVTQASAVSLLFLFLNSAVRNQPTLFYTLII